MDVRCYYIAQGFVIAGFGQRLGRMKSRIQGLINADSIYNRYPKVWIWREHAYAISLSDCRTIFGHIMRLIEPRKREATLAITAAG